MKKIIFHTPIKINHTYNVATQIRPMKMLNAFKEIGYEVDIIMGYGAERKKQINKIVDNIKKGEQYDFIYIENSTSPLLLTEKSHFPWYPLMDYKFLYFLKKKNIKISLFYRDIYWVFDDFINELPKWKALVIKILQHYDLFFLRQLLDVLYVPSLRMYEYFPKKFSCKVHELPPACDVANSVNKKNHRDNILEVFYVGGIGNHYDLRLFVKVISSMSNIKFTLCCRKPEWEKVKNEYARLINNNILTIVHEADATLAYYYSKADVACMFFKPNIYREFAMPVKLFEYIAHKKPIIATSDTAAGNFVRKHDIGWSLAYDEKQLSVLLELLSRDTKIIDDKITNIEKIIDDNTWCARAKQVKDDLS